MKESFRATRDVRSLLVSALPVKRGLKYLHCTLDKYNLEFNQISSHFLKRKVSGTRTFGSATLLDSYRNLARTTMSRFEINFKLHQRKGQTTSQTRRVLPKQRLSTSTKLERTDNSEVAK